MPTPPHTTGTTVLWEGGFSAPSPPPDPPDLATGAITIVSQQPPALTGSVVTYSAGRFTSQRWTGPGGPAVPLLIEVLQPAQVRTIRTQVLHQLQGSSNGLDDIPLRAFADAAGLYLERKSSDRFAGAVLGSVTEPNPGQLLGDVSWPAGTTGTVLASADGVAAQSHLAPIAATDPTPLRAADLESLVSALQAAVARPGTDARWQEILAFAEGVSAT